MQLYTSYYIAIDQLYSQVAIDIRTMHAFNSYQLRLPYLLLAQCIAICMVSTMHACMQDIANYDRKMQLIHVVEMKTVQYLASRLYI